jgi:phosphopantothenoylcysteine decarboxylase/phosphopantothenate--cysteine ligase
MGVSLCWAACRMGYQVTAVSGPVDYPFPPACNVVSVKTALEMYDHVTKRWPESDIFVGTAAVLDWDIETQSATKIKKENGLPVLNFKLNPDILSTVGKMKKSGQYVLGFAAETENLLENALKKLKHKNCDAVFANDVSLPDAGFEKQTNSGLLVDLVNKEPIQFSTQSKQALSEKLLRQIEVGF